MSQRERRTAAKPQAAVPPRVARFTGLRPARALLLPLTFTLLLVAVGLSSAAPHNPRLLWSFLGAGASLLSWSAVLLALALRRGRTLAVDVDLRKQHYLQACAQGAVLLYWGSYWREVGDFAYLIAAQLLLAYAFDALLTWSRRDTYTFGFGPFPIIFSINLFLWFKPDWFYLQFLMVAVGFAAKELIRWTKDGRQAHIFNPSSFPLGLVSIILILTGTTALTWGPEIATTQFNPPYIYLLIFLVALPGQFLFGVGSMTLAAVATTFMFGMAYLAATGSYFFINEPFPIAIFLGMHLLFTDPSTSPRTELGRLIFGVLYGLSVVALFALLGRAGVPTFYDKLLPVPILNLMIRGIDRAARSNLLKRFDPGALGRRLAPQRRNLAYMSVWSAVFVIMQFLAGSQIALARGDALLTQGRIEEAIAQYREVVRTEPDHFAGHNKLGFALMQVGRSQDALAAIRRAVELQPDNPETHNNLGLALAQAGRSQEAVASLQHAIELQPDYAEAQYNLAHTFIAVGKPSAAAGEFRNALRGRPDWPVALAALAWLQATQADPDVRDPAEAVRLASRAADLTERRDVAVLDALAAAYAAAGRFDEAIRTAEAAVTLAASSAPDLAAAIRARLSLYRAGQPVMFSGR